MKQNIDESNGKWTAYAQELQSLLTSTEFIETGKKIPIDEGFTKWADLTELVKENERTVYLIGNGASASMASHFAADLAKNGKLHTQVFSDLAIITAISNDMGYEHVFSEPLRRRARAGDMLVAISSSGASQNILAAIDVAKELGVLVVGLSAMERTNPLRNLADLSIYVPAVTYGHAETSHAAILHHWMDAIQHRYGADQF
ncbi:MAG: SIS domain-containing protein [Kiritimatiellae bacterium]|nr:SIS domain-containing protein [Kiritimatiellia bacterium]